MWQVQLSGCGVRHALLEMMAFSQRARSALRYGRRREGLPDIANADRPMSVAIAHLSAKAFYDVGSSVINHGVMLVGQLFVYVGPGLYISFEPTGNYDWLISIAHLNKDGSVNDDLPVPQSIQGTGSFR